MVTLRTVPLGIEPNPKDSKSPMQPLHHGTNIIHITMTGFEPATYPLNGGSSAN